MFKKKNEYKIAYDDSLIPPLNLMREEGIDVLEEWFRWGEEWSLILRAFGKIKRNSNVLEIGCGLGRTAFPLRFVLSEKGSFNGFEICKNKIDFLQKNFTPLYKNFNFIWANVHNTYYNADGKFSASEYKFPYEENKFDLVYAASVFTHMLPDAAKNYFRESARVLKSGGRCVFSFFVLDNYKKEIARPFPFSKKDFAFDNHLEKYGEDFATVVLENPEQMTAFSLKMINDFAEEAGLKIEGEPVPGFWSGNFENWIGAQDLIILKKE